jgi:hypothetical protein
VAVSPDGQRVYVAQETLQVVDLTKRPATATKVLDLAAQANSLAFTPDGRQLVVGEWRDGGTPPGTVELVDVGTKKVVAHRDVKGGAMGVAVSPDQAPVARLHVSAGAPSRASTFDASASTVAYGTIASYRWYFGDGSAAVTTTTPRASHSYAHAGHFTVRVTATDSVGTSTARVFTGRMMLRNGGPSATTSAVVNVAAHTPAGGPAAPPATPTHQGLAATGSPDIGRNVGIALVCLVAGAGLIVIGRRRYNARHR